MHEALERVLLSEEQIVGGIDRVAAEVTRAYAGVDFTAVCVLKGSCIFASDLVRRIPAPLGLTFVAVESYRDGTRPGELEFRLLPHAEEIVDTNLLVVDDILDSGRTMSGLVAALTERGARDVKTCVFLDKPARREVDVRPDFRCFEVEDCFVVGFGLDHAGRFRNLPYVAALRPEHAEPHSGGG